MSGDSAVEDLSLGIARRREEIGRVVLARVRAIGVSDRTVDPEYLDGLRKTVEVAIDHAVDAALAPSDQLLPVPGTILIQARLAARSRVELDTVLRRYLAGHAIVGDFLLEEADRLAVGASDLRRILRLHAATIDQVLAAISGTYAEEAAQSRRLSGERRDIERVRRLLEGELLDSDELGYPFDRWHVGLVARGSFGRSAVAELASILGADRLVVESGDGQLWAWLATRERLSPERLIPAIANSPSAQAEIGVGEPARNRAGWRLTHEQARAAHSVTSRGMESPARYADVASVASALQDELLSTSLREMYIAPLREGPSGAALRETLRAYLTADQNVTSTSALLGVSRNTVTNRIRTIERRLGPLRDGRVGDIALAMRLDEVLSDHQPEEVWT